MAEYSMTRRDFLKRMAYLGGTATIPAILDSCSGSGYEDRFLKSLKSLNQEEQFKALADLEKSSIQNTKFPEEYEIISNFIEKNIDPPKTDIQYGTDLKKPGSATCLLSRDKVFIYLKPKRWIRELRKGVPYLHIVNHHGNIHILDDNFSERDKVDDLLCEHGFITRDAELKKAFEEDRSLGMRIHEGLFPERFNVDIEPLLAEYRKIFNLEGSPKGVAFNHLKETLKKYESLRVPSKVLKEAHAYFVATTKFGFPEKTSLNELEKVYEKAIRESVSMADLSARKKVDISKAIFDMETLYGTLLKAGLKIPEAHITASKIVGDSLYVFDPGTRSYPRLTNVVDKLGNKLRITPEEARETISKIWIPYKINIATSVRNATKRYLKNNFG